MSSLRRACLGGSAAFLGALVFACVGDDPDLVRDGPADAAASTNQDSTASTADAAEGDRDVPDDSSSPADAATSDAGFDAGPPAWTAVPTTGTQQSISSSSTSTCVFELLTVQTAAAPPQWSLYLVKRDADGQTCEAPKGARSLVGGAYSTAPAGKVLFTYDQSRLVVAYSAKESPSGSAPTVLHVTQIDPVSGNTMHDGLMKTKSVAGQQFNPTLSFTDLFFADPGEQAAGTVRLKGTGSFPGETGSGAYFLAKYVGFLGAAAQLASAADSCDRLD